ncbi:peptidyl-prolyl cis-trans isomerase [bacterium]|nr:peptidyl-prolyl cis-trans isomerase [bacterium]
MLCGCTPPQNIVATIDGEKITRNQVRARLDAYEGTGAAEDPVAPEQQTQFANAKAALDQLINERLLLIEAQHRGILTDTDRVDPGKCTKALRVVLSELGKEVAFPSYKEAYDYYEQHQEEFSTESRYQLEHLLLDTEHLAWEMKEKLEKGQLTMAEAANNLQATANRPAGRNSERLITVAEMPVGLATVLPNLKLGQTSAPVATPYGYHLVRIRKKSPAGSIPFPEVENRIKDTLFADRLQKNFQRWLKQSQEQHSIKIYHQHLTAL